MGSISFGGSHGGGGGGGSLGFGLKFAPPVADEAVVAEGPVGDSDEDGPEQAATKASAPASEMAVNSLVEYRFIKNRLVRPEIFGGRHVWLQACFHPRSPGGVAGKPLMVSALSRVPPP